MSRARHPPHLIKKRGRPLQDGTRRVWWLIKDGNYQKRTGFLEHQITQAEQALSQYIGEKHDPASKGGKSSEIPIADVLNVYFSYKISTTSRPKELAASIKRLNDFWGAKTVSEILSPSCRDFAKQRKTLSGARRDLENLRAAVKHYKAEYGMEAEPIFTLPDKSPPRERWLTRAEAARLLKACRRESKRKHLARFLLIGIYTATRHDAILRLQWMPNTTGGWVDLENGVMYRRAENTIETKKRKPPIRIPNRLLAHMRRWYRHDAGIRHVVHFEGRPIKKLVRSFSGARRQAGLDDRVIPHALRHTAITWLCQAGLPIMEVSGFAGVTIKELERTYLHHHPDYQTSIINVRLMSKTALIV